MLFSGFDPNVGAVQHIDSQQASLEQVIGSPYTGNKSNLTASSATAITPTTSTVAGSLVLRDVLTMTNKVLRYMKESRSKGSCYMKRPNDIMRSEPTLWDNLKNASMAWQTYGRKRRVLHCPKWAGLTVTAVWCANIGEQHSSFSGTQNVPVQQIPSQEMTTSSDISSGQESGGLSATPTVVIHEVQPQTPVPWGEFSI
ncbi:hypothetical protein Tco_0233695 [Tanacetum coccineum]